ncbi:hypothetical protein [Herminiimonas contaminans]|uniref:Uncharacterized protein n=1 Tax=Herminiimonas contaminans TaxID=1111140 RepID=A0ABS0ESH4_9BURK|nr:hypothetical protein [Herminiimonas contaminans]MBF8177795.1 hypothetical protein [Herminiimonas contaminans]
MKDWTYIECHYFVRTIDPISKKWYTTRWRMTEQNAKELYAEGEYEILWDTKVERLLGGDMESICSSSFLKKPKL